MTNFVGSQGADPRKVGSAIDQALRGKINSVGTVTLTANGTSTVVNNAFTGSSSAIYLSPQTAHAAAALATTYIDPADFVSATSFTITHANNTQTDRTFGYVILG